MGKHEPMTAKAIANRIKAKGLQKIKYYCEMCKKQCRDDNGFKCHILSEAHQRQALIVGENPEKFVSEFSKQFMDGFLYILKTRYKSKRILANTVFQEYIKDKQHIHMNGTRWTSLTEFANWLGESGIVTVDESERGVMITYIDKDPDTLRRQEMETKRAEQAKRNAEQNSLEIERQKESTRKIYEQIERDRPKVEPTPIEKVIVRIESETVPSSSSALADHHEFEAEIVGNTRETCIERPVFKVQPITLKKATPSGYKPPPPKRKVIGKPQTPSKKPKLSAS